MLIWFLQEYAEIQNWMNDNYFSLLSSLEFLKSQASLAEERRIWLSRNIKLATRIQNMQARDTIFKCITIDRQTMRRSLLVACLFKTSEADGGRRRRLFVFQLWQLPFVFAFTRPRNQLNFFKRGIMMFCCDGCASYDKHTSHRVDNWYLLTFTSWMLT